MALLDHRALAIIKGVGITPGDTASAEQAPVVLDLLNESTGYSLSEWSPNIPSLKGGGVWADNPSESGRSLLAGADTNVIEDMTVILHGTINKNLWSMLSDLALMRQAMVDFWESQWQIEPVYLLWWAQGAPGPQYALLYSMEYDLDWKDTGGGIKVNITLERDYGWTPIAPGESPKKWTKYWRNLQFNADNAYIFDNLTTDDHLYQVAIKNCTELTGVTTVDFAHYVDIAAADIPGDLPALVSLWAAGEAAGAISDSLFVARWTRPVETPSGIVSTHTLPAGHATVGTDTVSQADTGGVDALRMATTFVTTTLVQRFEYVDGTNLPMRTMLYSGRFRIFMRARLSAAGSVGIRIRTKSNAGANVQTGNVITLTDTGSGGTGNTTEWAFLDMGIFSIPNTENNVATGALGRGINEDELFSIAVDARRDSGTPVLYITDVILLPIDEAAAFLVSTELTFHITSGQQMVYDNSRYLSRGHLNPVAILSRTTLAGSEFGLKMGNIEIRGRDITLQPRVRNRLFFLQVDISSNQAKAQFVFPTTPDIGLNLVPRWSGVRDA